MSSLDPITLQVISSAFRSICEEMGAALVRAAYSTNIKERRDCSTALFDASGRLIAQAEHIPIHLGAMPDAVEAVRAEAPAAGDVFILNDPFKGGTHLPDITLVSAIDIDGKIIAYAASRAHHADVGGREPGSMPADSTSLEDEGVVIPPTRLVAGGQLQDGFLAELLSQVRRPDERQGDLRAQIGAGSIAQRRLRELVRRSGEQTVLAAMDETIDYAERRMREAIRALPDGSYRDQDYLERNEWDLVIRVTVTIAGDEMRVDFEGTVGQEEGNLNCPMSVTRSACYYVLRTVTDPDIPPNAGALAPIEISAPEGCLVNAVPPAAVVGGNVEASQRIADAMLLALSRAIELPAQGQGTMNNISLGNDSFNYYETIGGGAGACPDRDGASGIHLGTTNTLNTPIEALETSFPLSIERYEFRENSGGEGLHRGGDGVIRSIRVLEPSRLSLLTDRRRHNPRGAAGGEAGAPGINLVNDKAVAGKVTMQLEADDQVTVKTPGGGGYGVVKVPEEELEDQRAPGRVKRYIEETPMTRKSVHILLVLLALVAAILLIYLATFENSNRDLAIFFHLDFERNFPSTFNTFLLGLAAISAYACAGVDKRRYVGRMPARYVWYVIGTALVYMTLDEYFSIHERFDYFLNDMYGRYPALANLGGYGWPWTLFAVVFVIIIGTPALYFTYQIFKGRRYLFVLLALAGSVFIIGAILFENVGVYLDHFNASVGSHVAMIIEESMEMLAVALAIFVFLRYRGERQLEAKQQSSTELDASTV